MGWEAGWDILFAMPFTCTILFCNQHQKTNINQKQILYLPSTTIISYHLADFAPPRLIAFPTFPHALNSRSSLLSHPQPPCSLPSTTSRTVECGKSHPPEYFHLRSSYLPATRSKRSAPSASHRCPVAGSPPSPPPIKRSSTARSKTWSVISRLISPHRNMCSAPTAGSPSRPMSVPTA